MVSSSVKAYYALFSCREVEKVGSPEGYAIRRRSVMDPDKVETFSIDTR